jgi:UDP-glucose 4-epimerase
MKALILGGNGFIGSHLVDRLLLEGHEVRVFDKYEERYRKPLPGVEYRFGEFGNRGLLADALSGIDTVFHLISTSLPKTSNDDPAFDVQSNVIETIFLLEQCVAGRVGKVVFVSSGGTVYGNPVALPIHEESPTNPECSYGITKLTVEKYLALFKHLHGLDYTIVRPSNPYGSRQNPNGIQGAIAVFLGKVARREPIEIWGDGSVVRDYLHISDLVNGLYLAAVTPSPHRLFNLGSGRGHSLQDIVAAIRVVTGGDLPVLYKPLRPFDVPEIFLDITLARREFSWEPLVSLDQGIRETWDFVKKLY